MKIKFFNYHSILFIFFFILTIKFLAFIFIINFTSLGGGDADLYHGIGLGQYVWAGNAWGKILMVLSEWQFYDRTILKTVIFLTAHLGLPLFVAKIIENAFIDKINNTFFWHIACLLSMYPVVFFFSLDIYRDIMMILLFLMVLYFMQIFLSSKTLMRYIGLLIGLMLSYYLIDWRPYLGFSLFFSFLFYKILIIRLFNFKFLVVLYFVTLSVFYKLGLLDLILLYRGTDGFTHGTMSLGIGLLDKNIFEFLILYMYSVFMQLFGLYIINLQSLFLFLLESIPFLIGLFYILKNKDYLTDFTQFLLLFSVVYATIWLLGNDNLGTAVRLRMYNYISILIVASIVYLKRNTINKGSKCVE